MARLELKSLQFRREREDGWRRLEALVTRAEQKGLGSLSGADLLLLPRLYRSALSSLNVARAISLDRNALEYLEALCQRAYFQVYGVRRRWGEAVRAFFARGFPAAVRRLRASVAIAALLLLLAALAGHALTSADPERSYAFVSDEMAAGRTPEASTERLRDALYATEGTGGGLATFASALFSHNAKVGMLCFALGFAAGVPVVFLLVTNGLALGAFSSLYAGRGLAGEFAAWIAPHGVTELLAVVLCAGAGLSLAQAVVFPGRLPRLASIAARGREAGTVVLGALCLFLVAGLIEGFFRQLVHSLPLRYAVAAASAGFWIWYFAAAGRKRAVP